jgi:hypothetical protein
MVGDTMKLPPKIHGMIDELEYMIELLRDEDLETNVVPTIVKQVDKIQLELFRHFEQIKETNNFVYWR